MKKEIAEKWVSALRSGKYKKGRNYLHRDGNYCCLGVLCDISGISQWNNNRTGVRGQYYLEENQFLPKAILEWAGINTGAPERLIELNDNVDSFQDVVSYIEKNYKLL